MSQQRSSRRSSTAVRTTATRGAATADGKPDYPGKRFGLPESGPGAVAPMGRRVVALIVDWVLCEIIVSAVTRHQIFASTMDSHYYATMYWTLLVFGLEVWLFTAVAGMTVGKRLLGIKVIATNGGRAGLGWLLLRTILLFFVVPPLLSDRDLRGLHDRAADTIVVRL
ncbi:MAG: RDD family protein [Trebonia sp.]